jgi:hypothetical protein
MEGRGCMLKFFSQSFLIPDLNRKEVFVFTARDEVAGKGIRLHG